MSRDTSFYYSFLVLPPRKRSAIIAVWDFCRAVDDAVDEIGFDGDMAAGLTGDALKRARTELTQWRQELGAAYQGTPRTRQGQALQRYIAEFNLPREQFEHLIDGVEMDLDFVRYQTFAQLSEYCRRVASAVGLVCLEIFGYRNPRSRVYAESLGMALQLTNIIRDVQTDLSRGRVYLPQEDLERFGVTMEDLRAGKLSARVVELLRFECERAHYYYRRAALALPVEDAPRLIAAEIMGAIYFEILRRIERHGYDVFSARIRVPRPKRAVIALRLWLRSLVGLNPARVRTMREQ